MATIEDASMPDALVIEIIDFLNVLLSGSKQTVRNLEDMVKRKQNMYNLEEWEEFERHSSSVWSFFVTGFEHSHFQFNCCW